MNILVTICARGGSKGIPGKNIRPLCGVPIIGYSIHHAQRFAAAHGGADISLSTDCAQIRAAAAVFGLSTLYVRPTELAGDAVGKEAVLRDLLLYEERARGVTYDYLLDLDVTSPLRTQEDLDGALVCIEGRPDALNLFSVSPANRNPYFNMVEKDERGFYPLCKMPREPILARQKAPCVYDVNASFYFFRRQFFLEGWTTVFTDRSLAYVVPHVCFDLDGEVDFAFLEYLMEHNKLGFPYECPHPRSRLDRPPTCAAPARALP